jgi:zinc protease
VSRMVWLTILASATAALALAQTSRPKKSKMAKPQNLHVFSSNLLTVPSPSPLYEVKIMVRAGSAEDSPGREGTANLVARGLIEGGFGAPKSPVTTQKLAAITRPWGDRAFPKVLVDKQSTTFSVAVPRDAFSEFVDQVLAPMLQRPLWLDGEMDRLRRDQLADIQSHLRFEDQESLGLLALDNLVFAGSPLAHLSAGTVRGLQAITRQDLDAFYKRYYTSGNMYVVTTINDRAALEKLMSALPSGPAFVRPLNAMRTVLLPGRRVLIITQPNAIATGLHLGFPIRVTRSHPDYWPLFIANTWLGAHRDSFSHLYHLIREDRGYNYGDYSYIEYYYNRPASLFPPPNTPRERQYFSIWIRPVAHQYAHFILKAMTAELDRFVRQGLTPDEVAASKIKARTLYLNFAESRQRQVGYRLDDLFYNMRDHGYLEEMLNQIDSCTPQQVNDAIRNHLQTASLTYVIVTNDTMGQKLADDIATGANVVSKTPAEYHMSEPIPPDKQQILRQDEEWKAYSLNIPRQNIEIRKAADMFEYADHAATAPGDGND